MTSGRLNLPFTGIPSFLRAPIQADLEELDADLAFIGIPTDEGGPWKPGTRFGPRSVREQSVRFAGYGSRRAVGGYYDIDEDRRFLEYEIANSRIIDCGDVDITYTNREQTFDDITTTIHQILKRGAVPVVIGGDHGVSYPVVRAYEQPISVVQFDAHLDYTSPTDRVRLSNGTPLRLISELPNVTKLVQAGIRSLRTKQDQIEDARANGVTVLSMRDYRKQGVNSILEAIPAGGQTYITIDIDAFDLPLVPGCASGELCGFTYDELREAVFALASHTEIVGFDIVEINPMLDVASGATALLGAQLAIELMARLVEHPAYLERKGRLSGTNA